MAFCTNCGTKLDGDACTSCGKVAGTSTAPQEPPISSYYQPYPPVYQQPNYSQPYQQPNYQSQQYPVNQQQQPQYYPQGAYQPYWSPAPEKPKNNALAIILVIVVVGIVLIASFNSAVNMLDLEDYYPIDYDYEVLPNKYALVVGISNYANFEDLRYCDNDARAWEHYLRMKGYEVRTLIDSQATKDAIIEGILWMDSVETNESDCAFTFSGHGIYEYGSYICPYDSSLYSYDMDISNFELGDAFYDFDSEHIFFFFDSCYSGGMDAVIGQGRYVTQSSGIHETSYEYSSEQNGLWTYYFLEWGLTDNEYEDMNVCFDNVYDLALQTSIRQYEASHPEEEYYGSVAFYL